MLDPTRVIHEVERLISQGFVGDLYLEAAANVLGVSSDQVTPGQRQQVKLWSFATRMGATSMGSFDSRH